jgi:hypothetical protein
MREDARPADLDSIFTALMTSPSPEED